MKTKNGKHISPNGAERWYLNGKVHREDGPAITLEDGYKAWCLHDQCHRIGGPAVIWANGAENWYQDGVFHRIDGPAITGPDTLDIWCVRGDIVYSNKEFQSLTGISDEELSMIVLKYGNIG